MHTPMFDGGRVSIRSRQTDGLIDEVEIRSLRPQVATLLRGKLAEQAVQLVPSIFAVCGRAQGQAAGLALAAACGFEVPPRLDATVEVEVMREHLWRLLLDLPPLLGVPAQRELFLAGQHAVAAGNKDRLHTILADEFWNKIFVLLDALEQPNESLTPLLPAFSARQSLVAWPLLDGKMANAPQWQGAAAETGGHARWTARNPVVLAAFSARWRARYVELQSWADGESTVGAGGTVSSTSNGQNRGRSVIETARGLLMHEITLDADRIADYVIVAPTEWNFHPCGSLFRWLIGRRFLNATAMRSYVGHAVAALDPCVEWELVINAG